LNIFSIFFIENINKFRSTSNFNLPSGAFEQECSQESGRQAVEDVGGHRAVLKDAVALLEDDPLYANYCDLPLREV
jgi:hypothetical protein